MTAKWRIAPPRQGFANEVGHPGCPISMRERLRAAVPYYTPRHGLL